MGEAWLREILGACVSGNWRTALLEMVKSYPTLVRKPRGEDRGME